MMKDLTIHNITAADVWWWHGRHPSQDEILRCAKGLSSVEVAAFQLGGTDWQKRIMIAEEIVSERQEKQAKEDPRIDQLQREVAALRRALAELRRNQVDSDNWVTATLFGCPKN